MYKYGFLILSFFTAIYVSAQKQDSIKISQEQIESLFLNQNLELLAEQMNIGIAEAAVIQAKLWENPSFSLGDFNLWTTEAQKESVLPLFGKTGRKQFSLELSQLVQTARKRGKLISREKVSKEMAIQDFEEVIRALKLELRTSIQEIIYLQDYQKILSKQEELIRGLISAYKNQVSQGNIAKNELIRLQSSLLELTNEIYEVKTDFNEKQRVLKSLLSMESTSMLVIDENNQDIKSPDILNIDTLLNQAAENRPDVKKANLQIEYFDKDLAYEKAQRVPDLTFSAGYDRAGGVWKDYVGFGVSFDLPILNRNKGNIKAAQLGKEQSKYLAQNQVNVARQEVAEAFNNYKITYDLQKEIENENLSQDLDFMIDAYTRNLMKRNISMLEYIDFMEAYKTNKQTMLNTRKNMFVQFEQLQYATGVEIK
ncbi:TolC family protein [Apibacter raozihei]|uniref:TolC family protein n=1 Tax=Apibacter TaxID=1778601 RepID=UPI000FE431D7|nr:MULTISPECIES: TolC family protein [Apibacter]